MRVSGWCSPCCSPRAHGICEDRIKRGLLELCECDVMGGHKAAERLGITPPGCDDGGLTNSAPGGASTPNSQGLADYTGVDS